jgi:hypothetical protein
MENQRKYLGKGKSTHPDFTNVSICLSDVDPSDVFEFKGKKYIKLTVAKMKQPDSYGKTHTVFVDDFKPEKIEQKERFEAREEEGSELPF